MAVVDLDRDCKKWNLVEKWNFENEAHFENDGYSVHSDHDQTAEDVAVDTCYDWVGHNHVRRNHQSYLGYHPTDGYLATYQTPNGPLNRGLNCFANQNGYLTDARPDRG